MFRDHIAKKIPFPHEEHIFFSLKPSSQPTITFAKFGAVGLL